MLTTERERLQADWTRLLHTCTADDAGIRPAFDDLAAHYAAPERHYHTLDHIRAVLDALATAGAPARSPAALELAAWFHDAIYDPRAGDNEEKSAEYARAVLAPLGAPALVVDEAARLILLTKTHQADAGDADGRALLDADLSVLGAASQEYDRYAAAIRREYAWVAEDVYRVGRRRVLEGFLRRPRIYQTDPMFVRLEAQARRNLRCEIATLGGDPA